MEKLIELLNEYSKKKHNLAMRELNGELGLGFHYLNYGSSYSELFMISKKYEFIKWLVENDKIKPLRKFIGWETDEDEPYIQFDLADQYIAYLSISDTPIEDLISYLK